MQPGVTQMALDIVFDLDGTLLDSALDILSALEQAALEVGLHPEHPPEMSVVGPPVRGMLDRWRISYAPEHVDPLVIAFRRIYDTCEMPETRPYPGVIEALINIRQSRNRTWIATNKPELPTRYLLSKWFDGLIDGWCCIDSLVGKKLSKLEMLQELSRLHRFTPAKCFMVGDSAGDIQAGKAMQWLTIAALYGYGSAEEIHQNHPDFLIHKIKEIHTCLVV